MKTAVAAVLKAKQGEKVALKKVSVEGHIRNLVSEITISQTYQNEETVSIEAVYTFPLPLDAEFLDLTVQLGERLLAGRIVEKAEAQGRYEEAITDGDTAVMLEKSGEGLYTMNVGNLQPGESAVIRFRYSQLQKWNGDLLRFLLPTVIAPRYGDPGAAGLAPHQQPAYDLETDQNYTLRLRVSGLLAQGQIESPTHRIAARRHGEDVQVELAQGAAFLDRDFVLTFRLPQGGQASAGFDRDRKGYVVLASFKPDFERMVDNSPRNLTIVVDCSGSMNGDSIAQARKALLKILESLRPQDHFNIVAFGSGYKTLFATRVAPTEMRLAQARRFVQDLDADMGGTEIGSALQAAYRMAGGEGKNREILLITDGEVWDDGQLIRQANESGCRVFTVGVGSAVSEAFVRRMAEETGGACELVSPNEDMAERIHRHFQRIYSPCAKQVTTDWPAAPYASFPEQPGPLFEGDTLHLFAWFASRPEGEVTMTVTPAGQKTIVQSVSIREFSGQADMPLEQADDLPSTLSRIAAAARLRALEWNPSNAPIGTALAKDYQLMSLWTNYLLIDVRAENQKAADLPELRKVPQMLAAGWGGIGSLNWNVDYCEVLFEKMVPAPGVLQPGILLATDLAGFVEAFNQLCQGTSHGDFDTIRKLEDMGLPEKVTEALFKTLLESSLDETDVIVAFLYLLTKTTSGASLTREARRVIIKAYKNTALDRQVLEAVEKMLPETIFQNIGRS